VGNERRGIEWGGVLVSLSVHNADGVLQCVTFVCDYSNHPRLDECRGVLQRGQFSFVSRLVSPSPEQSEHNGENVAVSRGVVLLWLLQG
jgi:hypothetical protein